MLAQDQTIFDVTQIHQIRGYGQPFKAADLSYYGTAYRSLRRLSDVLVG